MLLIQELAVVERLEDSFLCIGDVIAKDESPILLKQIFMETYHVEDNLKKVSLDLRSILMNVINNLDWDAILNKIKENHAENNKTISTTSN